MTLPHRPSALPRGDRRHRRSRLALGTILCGSLALAGCGGADGSSSAAGTVLSALGITPTPDPSPTATPTPTPTPTATATPTPSPTPTPTPTATVAASSVVTPSIAGLASIPSNFDTAADIDLSQNYVGGHPGAIPASAAPDVVGAFRFVCNAGQLAYDDPIVYPGQPGKSHLHQFFGNTSTNASSTYESLRTTGDSTCMNPLNRSAYWIPAMLTGEGHVVRPDAVTIYYKRRPASDPYCFVEATKGCTDIPRGLRFVFGYNMTTGKAGDSPGDFICANINSGDAAGAYPTITQASADCAAKFPSIGARIHAPECWDGVNLDSPDHRSHMAYPSYGDWGYLKCPAGYPYVIPTFTLAAWYTLDGTFARDGSPSWHLSSDEMPGMTMTPGSTLHADWFGAWDDPTLARWTAACINKLLNCSGGDLGDGGQMKQIWQNTLPRVVVVPARPS